MALNNLPTPTLLPVQLHIRRAKWKVWLPWSLTYSIA